MTGNNEDRKLTCPKCKAAMEVIKIEEVDIDRCTGCQGIFFDICEHKDLATLETEPFDAPMAHENSAMDKIDHIKCPVCKVDMLRLVAIKKRDIKYEKCPMCSGVYFDAGEFTEFKEEETTWDVINKMLRG
jgi:Zn-finger nucleic acid-binding protein